MTEPIQLFEHEAIAIGERGFTARHFNALVGWNERNGGRFLEVGHRKLRCRQYVGVVQVGDLVIEVLPKADRDAGEDDKPRWHGALLTMLGVAHGLRLHETDEADLRMRRRSLMDLFLDRFVHEVRALVHAGLVKQYRTTRSNLTTLKGRLDLPEHLRLNLVHQERFAVVHQAYDTDHLLHAILRRALDIVERTCTNAAIVGRAQDVNWAFDRVRERAINATTFDRLRLGRRTAAYKPALQLARLIILNFSPDLSSGREPVLSILFDMERLWEKFMFRLLLKHCHKPWSVVPQDELPFWEGRGIRPDLVLNRPPSDRIIADTKWKVPDDDEPSMSDLQQMFAYNIRFVSKRGFLLYPGGPLEIRGRYINAEKGWFTNEHHCSVLFIMPFDGGGKLDEAAIGDVLKAMTQGMSSALA